MAISYTCARIKVNKVHSTSNPYLQVIMIPTNSYKPKFTRSQLRSSAIFCNLTGEYWTSNYCLLGNCDCTLILIKFYGAAIKIRDSVKRQTTVRRNVVINILSSSILIN